MTWGKRLLLSTAVLVAAAAVAVAAWWYWPASNRPSPTETADDLIVYGHSIPSGGGASSPDHGYARLLADDLGLSLDNRAHGGHRAVDMAQVADSAPVPERDDLVVVQVGINDVLLHGTNPLHRVRDRLAVRDSLERITSGGARVLLVLECRPETFQHDPPYDHGSQAAWAWWNSMLRDEASRLPGNVEMVDACTSWPEGMLDATRYHPNNDGHEWIAQELAEVVS